MWVATYSCFSAGEPLLDGACASSSRCTATLKRFQNAGSRTPDIVFWVCAAVYDFRVSRSMSGG